jgi:hypothetical protein
MAWRPMALIFDRFSRHLAAERWSLVFKASVFFPYEPTVAFEERKQR